MSFTIDATAYLTIPYGVAVLGGTDNRLLISDEKRGRHFQMPRSSAFKKRRTDDCLALDLARWNRDKLTEPGTLRSGTWVWTYGRPERTARVAYDLDLQDDSAAFLRLKYTCNERPCDYRIQMVTTRPHFGGVRWWFLCPLRPNGRPCGRRVRGVYLSGDYFGCRKCHDLTYRSTQEWDGRLAKLAKQPDAISNLLASGDYRDVFSAMNLMLKERERDEQRSS